MAYLPLSANYLLQTDRTSNLELYLDLSDLHTHTRAH